MNMDKSGVFSKSGGDDSLHSDEALAKAQIARRLGLGFVIIAVLLGMLFLAENQFYDGGDTATVVTKPEPPANLTINTPDNRDAPQPVSTSAVQNAQEVGGQVTPVSNSGTNAAPEAETPPVTQAENQNPQAAEPSASPARKSGGGAKISNLKNNKPVPGVIPTAPLKPAIPSLPQPSPPATQVTVEHRKVATSGFLGGILLQAGVFSSYQKAEELHALLTLNGIPSTLETKVQVGPFANKAEADAARAKLKALGIESLVLSPRK
ncbi:MAG: hypothetical protein RIR18_1993 [Pseudomonadota bacterium]|jgi:DedD protein